MSYLNGDYIEKPMLAPAYQQRWMPSTQHPYPMNFVQAPSPTNQTLVYYNGKPCSGGQPEVGLSPYRGKPCLQGLSTSSGPIMFPSRESSSNPKNSWERKHQGYYGNPAIMYPTNSSIPGPFLQSYIALPNRQYPY